MLPGGRWSRNLRCYPARKGADQERTIEMGILEKDSSPVPRSFGCIETAHSGRIPFQLRLSSEACYSTAERPGSQRAEAAPFPAPPILRIALDLGTERHWEIRGLPWAGALESGAAGVDALGQETVFFIARPGTATAPHQRANYRLPLAGSETPHPKTMVWPHQAGNPVEAPHSFEDRCLGCALP